MINLEKVQTDSFSSSWMKMPVRRKGVCLFLFHFRHQISSSEVYPCGSVRQL